MEKELLEQLDGLRKDLEGKSKEDAQKEVKAFEEKFYQEFDAKVETKAKELMKVEVAELKSTIEKNSSDIKVVGDHADKLDIKLQKNKGSMKSEKKTFSETITHAIQEKTDEISKFALGETKSLSIEVKAVGDISTGNVTGGTRYGELFAPEIITNPSTRVHMDQILQPGSVGAGNSFHFMKENGAGEGGIAPVAEGATKSQLDKDLVEDSVDIETIAGWARFTNKAMSNIPGFLSYLQFRLPEDFRDVLDSQVLYGNGTSPNLKGILTSGNFIDQTTAVDKPVSEKIIDYISLFEDTHKRMANGILVRPATYYSMFTQTASGSGEYDLPFGVTIEGGQARILGVPIFATTALNATDIVVGDWARGAQLLTQEAMRIEFFNQDGDNVRTNKVTVRIEGNYALPVYGADYFVRGTTATS